MAAIVHAAAVCLSSTFTLSDQAHVFRQIKIKMCHKVCEVLSSSAAEKLGHYGVLVPDG